MDRPLTVPVEGQDVELLLQAWEDDPAWADRTGSLFADALPALRGDIGLPWPADGAAGDPRDRRAGTPDASAGVFDPAQNRMDVAYWADRGVVIHQAAHGWFNGDLLADRWANEGFATFYALRAAEQLGESADRPQMTDEARAASFPLNAWAASEAQGTTTAADAYGYAASLDAREGARRAGGHGRPGRGLGRCRRRDGGLPAAGAGRGCRRRGGRGRGRHPRASEASRTGAALLDLLEARSGQDLTPLWREWVVQPDEAALLDARAAARASYARTLALADGWQLPRAIRDALRSWQFETAETLMADARTVLAQRKAVTAMAERDGLELPDDMQRPVRERVHGRGERAGRGRAGRDRWRSRTRPASRSSDDDILSRIGMLGEHPEADLAEARAALAAGDLDASVAASDRAFRAWTVAWEEGRRRALLALAALATVVVLGSAVVGTFRRSRRAAASDASAGAASPGDGAAPA